jgi:hypothetical protein
MPRRDITHSAQTPRILFHALSHPGAYEPAEIKAKCIETLRQAGAVVDARAPGDAAAFKGWLRQISQHVAEASKEGGFLGIGGVPVSEAEKATLTEISSALKLAA